MTLELILSGLCAFVLTPCKQQTESVTMVFPGGPFHSAQMDFPKHIPVLMVDVTEVAPSSTAKPNAIFEAQDGTQFALFNLEGKVDFSLDGAVMAPSVKIGATFDQVPDLAKVIKGDDSIAKVTSRVFSSSGNAYSRAHLTLPFDSTPPDPNDPKPQATMEALSNSGEYDFDGGTFPAADRVHLHWDNLGFVTFTQQGKTIVLRDGGPLTGRVVVELSNFPLEIMDATTDLVHFPAYYFISNEGSKLDETKRHAPKKHGGGGGGSSAIKPVACVTCQGCS